MHRSLILHVSVVEKSVAVRASDFFTFVSALESLDRWKTDSNGNKTPKSVSVGCTNSKIVQL